VLNVLLQLLDDGRLTDGQGRTIDFRNVLVIMTSNLGSDAIRELADDRAAMVKAVNEALRVHFRPELLNRVDEVVIFESLTLDDLRRIVRVQLAKLEAMIADRGWTLLVSEAAVEALAREGFDPAYGARPLKRTIQRQLQNPLALRILEGAFPVGTKIAVDFAGGDFTFAS
jgi:ATP-dependent Clp protease ATP-binding subunit ClpB